MKNCLSVLILSALLFDFTSCTKEEKSATKVYTVSDLTDSLFTGGIEGPAVDTSGNLYVVNFGKEGTIGITKPGNKTELFLTLPQGSIGNGIRFDSHQNMFIADYPGHNILKVDMNTKDLSVFAHDSSMNQPNDIAIGKNDILFASDPNWANSTGNLWRIDRNGKTTLLEDSMGTTNGVEVGSSEKVLYVNESIQKNVWAYDLAEDGSIGNKRLLIHFNDEFGMDGMRCDKEGNLYITRHGKGTVAIVSPEGQLIKEIRLKGKKSSNISFGGTDGKTCYVTLQDRGVVETFRAEHPGREWTLANKK